MNEAFYPKAGYLLAGCWGVQPARANRWQGEPAALSKHCLQAKELVATPVLVDSITSNTPNTP